MEEIKNKLILVFYINIGGLSISNAASYVQKVQQQFESQNFTDLVQYFIPVRDAETRIECLNPQFITNKKIIDDFQKTLKRVDENFKKITKNFNHKKISENETK